MLLDNHLANEKQAREIRRLEDGRLDTEAKARRRHEARLLAAQEAAYNSDRSFRYRGQITAMVVIFFLILMICTLLYNGEWGWAVGTVTAGLVVIAGATITGEVAAKSKKSRGR